MSRLSGGVARIVTTVVELERAPKHSLLASLLDWVHV